MRSETDLRQIVKILFWQKLTALIAFLAIFVPVAVKTLTEPPAYTSSTKLLYRHINPNLTLSSGLVRIGGQELMNTEIELIRSYPVMSKVLMRLVAWRKARAELVPNLETAELPEPGTVGWGKAIAELSETVKVKPIENSNVIRISYTSEVPEEAAFVAQTVAEEYVKHHVQVQRSGQAEAFFAERIQDTRARLDSLERTLLAVKRRHGVVSYQQQERQALDRFSQFDQRLNELRTQILSHEMRWKQVRKALESPKLVLPGREIADHPLILRLRQRLADLKLKRADLIQRFRPEYAGVKMVDQQIEETEEQLREQLRELAEIEKASIASLRAEQKAIESTLEYLRNEVQSLPEKEQAISELELAIEETRRIYSLLLQRYEEARITEASDPRVANVVIVDPARVPVEPSGPKRARNLVLGFLFGMVGSLGMALVGHQIDPTVKSPEDIRHPAVSRVISVSHTRRKG